MRKVIQWFLFKYMKPERYWSYLDAGGRHEMANLVIIRYFSDKLKTQINKAFID